MEYCIIKMTKIHSNLELYHSLILLLLLLLFKQGNAITPHKPSCHDEESSALLQFKQSFLIDTSASSTAGAYPKVSSWKQPHEGENSSSCCSWDGVECDDKTGRVIGLDLGSSCLHGSINSKSSLFRLVHLQRLNLADNNFNYSLIPNAIRNFPRLTHLNLSASFFSGQVPFEISQLSKLSSLRLTSNVDPSSNEGLLKLDGSNFRRLVQNLTRLERLGLRFINISSTIPDSIANLSLLTYLDLHECELFGDFPVRIFQLQNLQSLYLRDNNNLIGYLPEFNQSSSLTTLDLHGTRFFGDFASSIEKLGSLKQLDLGASNFSGSLLPSALGSLRQLTYLDLSLIPWGGPIPDSYANLTELIVFRILSSSLTGPIPSWIGNFSKLSYLDLAYNSLNSSIPGSFSNLTNLEILYLQGNELTGRVEFKILSLQNLNDLDLGLNNNLELVFESTTANASTVPQFTNLRLMSCKMRSEFPYFLRHQKRLEQLDLRGTNMTGLVPKWLYNMSTDTLLSLNLENNHLFGFEQLPVFLPWVNLQFISLANNVFRGQLPVPAKSILLYLFSANKFTGEVSPLICNLTSLRGLDFSDNNFHGIIPHCFESLTSLEALALSNNNLSGTIPPFFGNFSDHLSVLLLQNNSFDGPLLQTYNNKSKLRMLDVSYNQLQGELPKSLANCLKLETLILSHNDFNDVFPFWLQTLPELKLLTMRHNGFLGEIRKPVNNQRFPKLRILDISYNNFTGGFLAEYIFTKYAMRSDVPVNQSTYMESADITSESGDYHLFGFSFTITSKGVDRYYSKIQKSFAVIDISSNNFEGEIDEWIGNLKGLWSLNASNNLLTGEIPSSFGNLTHLESLDLSNNKLSGKIPQQLAQITFLSQFDVSHNNLTGRIPQGPQLDTFNSTSYEGNPGLCGEPLPKKCVNPNAPAQPPSSSEEESDSGSGFELDWKFALAGFGSGLVVGVVLADMAIIRKRELFLEIAGKLIRLRKIIKRERSGPRN